MKRLDWKQRYSRKLVVLLLVVGFVPTLVACEEADWTDPDYISKRLEEGDSSDRQLALRKLDELDEDVQMKVAPALAKVYLDGGPAMKDAMQILVQLRTTEAKEAYMQEVRSNDTGYAASAAEALGEAGVTEALDDLIELYESTDDNDTKAGLLRAFTHMPDPKLVSPLTATLNLDVDNFPIQLHSYSCDILGDIGKDSPEALDEPAKRALVKGLFLGNMKGQNISRECGLAIQKAGKTMVPLLVETFKGDNEGVNDVLRRYNKPDDYQFPANRAKAAASVRLSALRAPQAVDLFLEDLEKEKGAPDQLSGNHAVSFRVNEGLATSEQINGLGDIGDQKAVDLLVDVTKGEYITDQWDEITDWKVELQLRQDAGFSLVRLGDRDAAGALLEMAKDGVIIDLERLAARIQDSDDPMGVEQRYQFNWMMARAYANLTGADGIDGLVSLIKQTDDAELKKKYESFIPMIEKGSKCLNAGQPAEQGKCFAKLLSDEDKHVREKAAYELSRLPKKVAGPIVADNLGHENLETREVLTFAAYRVPSEAMIAKIDEVLDDESSRSGAAYKLDHYRLRLLRAWLGHNSGAVAQK